MVNLDHVKQVQKDGFLMDNGQIIPISAAKAAVCRQAMMERVLKHGKAPRLAGTGVR